MQRNVEKSPAVKMPKARSPAAERRVSAEHYDSITMSWNNPWIHALAMINTSDTFSQNIYWEHMTT